MSALVTPPRPSTEILFRGVAVVDPVVGTSRSDQDVLVQEGRISRIAETGTIQAPRAETVHAPGRYLVPGYVDAHAHALNTPEEVEGSYALMLAAGVVGFRQMSGSRELLRRRRQGTLPQPAGAPALLAVPGDLLTPMNTSTEEAARTAVRAQKAQGADFVKAAMATPHGFLAALEEGQRTGMKIVGHLPDGVDPRIAAGSGMHCIEHLGPGSTVFTAASEEEQEIRDSAPARSLPPMPTVSLPGMEKLLEKIIRGIVINPAALTSESDAATLHRTDQTFDADKARELARLFVQTSTWQCPTLIRLHTQQFPHDPLHTEDPRRKYMAPGTLKAWEKSAKKFAKLPQQTQEALEGHWRTQLELTRILAEEGVPMLAGTDGCGGAYGVIPGFGLHDEFDLLASAGLDPLSILRMATSNAAEFFGRSDRAGRIAEGFEADAVLLSEDPLESHEALREIEGVLRGGQWWDREELDTTLENLAARPSAQ